MNHHLLLLVLSFYRELIEKAEETNSDIVFSKLVMDYGEEDKRVYNLVDFPFDELNGEECYEQFYAQEGLNFAWHITPNKIYSRRIWEKAISEFVSSAFSINSL